MMSSSAASSYIPIRDDSSSIRSLSLNERAFLCQSANNDSNNNNTRAWRADGRRAHEVRHIQIASLGRWEDGAECTVQWGMTRVTCLVSSELTSPTSLDRPNEGMLYFSVDISPMASTSFMHAAPVTTAPRGGAGGGSSTAAALPPLHDVHQKLLSNRILRTLERVVLTSGVMDLEALCVVSGKWVWKLHVSVTILDFGGNLVDASVLTCMAALSHYRQPQVSVGGVAGETSSSTNYSSSTNAALPSASAAPTLISPDFQQATPLPLHHIPLTVSFGLLPISVDSSSASSSSNNNSTPSKHTASSSSSVMAWIDPTDREELVTTGTLTMAMNIHGEVCWLDVHGCELPPSKLRECGQMAQEAIAKLCGFLDESLKQAEDKAQRDRLQRLQQRQQQQQQVQQQQQPSAQPTDSTIQLPPLPPSSDIQVPFWQGISEVDVVGLELMDVATSLPQQQRDELLLKQEEDYRNMALDYALGHVAAKAKENKPSSSDKEKTSSTSSLLAALLKSAASVQSTTSSTTTEQQQQDQQHQEVAKSVDTTKTSTITANEPNITPSAAKKQTPSIDVIDNNDNDDEEPTTMVWQSEFGTVVATGPTSTATANQQPLPSTTTKSQEAMDDEEDIDDLAMAIKKKKGKKKSKK